MRADDKQLAQISASYAQGKHSCDILVFTVSITSNIVKGMHGLILKGCQLTASATAFYL